MFGTTISKLTGRRAVERHEGAIEVAQLRMQVTRLQQALEQVIDASDDVLVDLQQRDLELMAAQAANHSAFANEWGKFEPSVNDRTQQVLLAADIDLRARDWLLAAR